MQGSYWIRKWLDDEGIKTLRDAERCLGSETSIRRLTECAEQQSSNRTQHPPTAGRNIVGGLGLDLSGSFECMQNECAMRAVDRTVHHTWHSFDCVVVSGFDPSEFIRLHRQPDCLIPAIHVLPHVRAALYIKDTGADDLLYFMDRPHALCAEHYREALDIAGLAPGFEAARDELADKLFKGCRLLSSERGGLAHYRWDHPALEATQAICRRIKYQQTEDEIAKGIAKDVAYQYAASTLMNSVLARQLSASFGQLTAIGDAQLSHLAYQRVADEVAYNLSIPIVENLPLKELMALRRNELGEFQAFQAAVRKAIEERVKAISAEDSYRIAQSVYDDVLEPALIDMERKMEKATEVFAKKSAATVTVGTVMATVGLLAFAPIAVPGIVLGAGGLLVNYRELLKDKREVQVADLHFLWKLSARATRHA